ncbi:hypothetical protein [Microcystis phage Mel-JY33]
MKIEELMGLRPFAMFRPLWEGEGEGGAGGGGGDTGAGDAGGGSDTSGDQKGGEAKADPDTGDGVVLGGGEADAGETSKTDDAKDKQGDDAKEGDDKGKGDDDPAAVVPEDGKYDLTLPEGVELDQQLAEAAFPVFKELGITTGQAQKLAEMFSTYRQADAQAVVDEWKTTQKGWVDTAKADPEYATDGWDAATQIANRALKQYGTPELAKTLRETGMGNHPDLIRFFYRIGKGISDDQTDTGEGKRGSEIPPEERLYGKTTPTSKRG